MMDLRIWTSWCSTITDASIIKDTKRVFPRSTEIFYLRLPRERGAIQSDTGTIGFGRTFKRFVVIELTP